MSEASSDPSIIIQSEANLENEERVRHQYLVYEIQCNYNWIK